MPPSLTSIGHRRQLLTQRPRAWTPPQRSAGPKNGNDTTRLGSSGGAVALRSWRPGDIPAPGDYDGDGTTDVAVFRPSNGVWFVNDIANTPWGTSGNVPLPQPPAGLAALP